MYSFRNDYSEGCCPEVLEAITAAAGEQNLAYGEDVYCAAAADSIRQLCGRSDAEVAFLDGGTQTNLLVISALLRPHQAAVAAATGHINVHETGAIEATGHKVCTVETPEGKLTPELIHSVCSAHTDEHMVQPKLVYISDTTELGTLYTKAELSAIREYCLEHGLWLYLDGARLGAALTAKDNDLTMADIASLTDAFYIGGTKNGALFGEALVMLAPALKEDFRFLVKQRGALTAKGYALGLQFGALFNGGADSCWFRYAAHENAAAARIAKAIELAGYRFLVKPQSNQLFPVLPDGSAAQLMEEFPYNPTGKLPGETVVRLVTSWSIPDPAVTAICQWFEQHPKTMDNLVNGQLTMDNGQ